MTNFIVVTAFLLIIIVFIIEMITKKRNIGIVRIMHRVFLYIGFFSLFACGRIDRIEGIETYSNKGDRLLGVEITLPKSDDFCAEYARVRDIGIDFDHISAQWTNLETNPNEFQDINNYFSILNTFYKEEQGKVYLTLLGPINTTVREMPADLIAFDFNHPDVISRYKAACDYLLELTKDMGVFCFIVGNEVDIYLENHPDEIDNYGEFVTAVVSYLKTKYPSIPCITFTTTLEGLVGENGTKLREIYKQTDGVSLTYYPLDERLKLKDMPDIANDIKSVIDVIDLPIYFQEIGCPTSFTNGSSETKQSQFVSEMFKNWDKYSTQVKAISIYQLTDWDRSASNDYLTYLGLPTWGAYNGFVRTVGLRTYAGEDKKAFKRLKEEMENRNW